MAGLVDQPPQIAALIHSCPICQKVFTREPPFNRHVKYCRSAQIRRKGRPKACIACNSSKTKCNFATPRCARCEKKDQVCTYGVIKDPLSTSIAAARVQNKRSHSSITPPISDEDTMRIDHLDWYGADNPENVWHVGFPSFHSPNDQAPLNLNNVGLDSFEDFIGGVVDWTDGFEFTNNQISSSAKAYDKQLGSADYIIAKTRATRALTPLSQENLASRHAANLISRSVSAFPQMMLRRHTFPPFIHPYWHKASVPENLANCMSIAQLFVSRTTDTRPFLWKTIEAEQKRCLDEKHLFSKAELQQAVQATTIYIVMAIIDQDEDTPARGARLMKTFLELKLQLQLLIGGDLVISETEAANPSLTWEEWIFAESRRRIGCLWFAITRVFALKTDRAHCSSMDDFHNLPLLSGKSIWEARTHDEWESEKFLEDVSYPIPTFGELLRAQQRAGDAMYARKLDNWEAGADKLGTMMNIAVELAG